MSFANATQHRVTSRDGLNLQVTVGGNPSGRPILLIHGYLFSSAVFARQFEGPLAESFRLIGFDLRGHGGSDKPRELAAYLDARAWADDVACVLDALNVDRAVIVGWSLGSRVAANYAWTHGFDRIAALNFVGAVLAPESHGPDAGLPAHLRDLLSPHDDLREAATLAFLKACAAPAALDQAMSQAFTATAMSVPREARLGARAWPVPYDGALGWIRSPLLFTHGRQDPLAPESTVRDQAAAVQGAELKIVEDAGHLVFLQQPSVFDRDLAELSASGFASSPSAE